MYFLFKLVILEKKKINTRKKNIKKNKEKKLNNHKLFKLLLLV